MAQWIAALISKDRILLLARIFFQKLPCLLKMSDFSDPRISMAK